VVGGCGGDEFSTRGWLECRVLGVEDEPAGVSSAEPAV
jgi:hypothetical protein